MSANGEHEQPSWELYQELLWIDPYLEERAAYYFFFKKALIIKFFWRVTFLAL